VPRRKIYLFESAEMTGILATNSATFYDSFYLEQAGPPLAERSMATLIQAERGLPRPLAAGAYADTPSRGGLAITQLMECARPPR